MEQSPLLFFYPPLSLCSTATLSARPSLTIMFNITTHPFCIPGLLCFSQKPSVGFSFMVSLIQLLGLATFPDFPVHSLPMVPVLQGCWSPWWLKTETYCVTVLWTESKISFSGLETSTTPATFFLEAPRKFIPWLFQLLVTARNHWFVAASLQSLPPKSHCLLLLCV